MRNRKIKKKLEQWRVWIKQMESDFSNKIQKRLMNNMKIRRAERVLLTQI